MQKANIVINCQKLVSAISDKVLVKINVKLTFAIAKIIHMNVVLGICDAMSDAMFDLWTKEKDINQQEK